MLCLHNVTDSEQAATVDLEALAATAGPFLVDLIRRGSSPAAMTIDDLTPAAYGVYWLRGRRRSLPSPAIAEAKGASFMAFEPSILTRNPMARRRYLEIMQAALDAVDPVRRRAHLRATDGTLWAGDRVCAQQVARIVASARARPSAPMARAVEDVLGDAIAAGLVVVKQGHCADRAHRDRRGEPPDSGMKRALRPSLAPTLGESAGADDPVLALISGGDRRCWRRRPVSRPPTCKR